jgi:hypothetical protein
LVIDDGPNNRRRTAEVTGCTSSALGATKRAGFSTGFDNAKVGSGNANDCSSLRPLLGKLDWPGEQFM